MDDQHLGASQLVFPGHDSAAGQDRAGRRRRRVFSVRLGLTEARNSYFAQRGAGSRR